MINVADYPRAALAARAGGTVFLRFVVGPDGRVTDCTVTKTSGRTDLDATTCRIVRKRFRYKPARDASGSAVSATIVGTHEWTVIR
jgi:protein TonB